VQSTYREEPRRSKEALVTIAEWNVIGRSYEDFTLAQEAAHHEEIDSRGLPDVRSSRSVPESF
jgi:hypothetical protein